MEGQGKSKAKVAKAAKEGSGKTLVQKAEGKASKTELKAFEYEHETPAGEKKNISGAWPKAYNPSVIEKNWYDWWEAAGFFSPDTQKNVRSKDPRCKFTLLIPPPNVTGSLHIGHALTNSIQDALVRWYRMMGYRTLYLPGLDHAGIATQSVVERDIMASEGKTRHDLGREQFLERAWAWKEQFGGRILSQLRLLGSSLDWSRSVFTMDPVRSKVHNESFVKLFNKGLIYRDSRLVNWDCSLQTAVSDVEVEYIDLKLPRQLSVRTHDSAKTYPFGYLWRFSYKVIPNHLTDKSEADLLSAFQSGELKFACKRCTEFYSTSVSPLLDGDVAEDGPSSCALMSSHQCTDPSCLFTAAELVVATTRPETIIGDTAVAIHPNDSRYTELHGKYLFHPILLGKKVPIIQDDILVDMEYGTGCVKVTPAHDPNDFECGRRNKLEFLQMLTDDGRIVRTIESTHNGITYRLPARFAEVMRFDGRLEMLSYLKENALYRGRAPNPMAVGTCQRSGDILEPIIKPQWYLNCERMAQRALDAVYAPSSEAERLLIVPEIHKDVWKTYLANIRPWCISRQLWWGHRIPCYKFWFGDDPEPSGDKTEHWIAASSEQEARRIVSTKYPGVQAQLHLKQDADVTDTWFSSGLFPFSCFANSKLDLSTYYPSSVLETGNDIIFFWVARMVMLSLELYDTLPFREVYLHALVRDAHGAKMSKSKGNVVDPIDVIKGITLQEMGNKVRNSNLPPKEIERALELQSKDFPIGIPECGTDALRFALCAYTGQGRSINLDVNKIVAYRNFCNKIFNAVKFGCYFSGICDVLDTDTGATDACGKFWQNNIRHYEDFSDFITKTYRTTLSAYKSGVAIADAGKLDPAAAYNTNDPNDIYTPHAPSEDQQSIVAARWILSRLYKTVRAVTQSLREFRIADACTAIYTFWYDDLCDVFLELVKPIIASMSTEPKRSDAHAETMRMVYFCCLDQGLRLLHPFMPFLSEELFQHLPRWSNEEGLETLMYAPYPTSYGPYHFVSFGSKCELLGEELSENVRRRIEGTSIYRLSSVLRDNAAEEMITCLKPLITAARALRGQYNIRPSLTPRYYIACDKGDEHYKHIIDGYYVIKTLCNMKQLDVVSPKVKFSGCGCTVLSATLLIYMDLRGLIDIEQELLKVEKEMEQVRTQMEKLDNLMKGPNYGRMPDHLRKQNDEKMVGFSAKLLQLEGLAASYRAMKDTE